MLLEAMQGAPTPRAGEDVLNLRKRMEVTCAIAGSNSCGIPMGDAAIVEDSSKGPETAS